MNKERFLQLSKAVGNLAGGKPTVFFHPRIGFNPYQSLMYTDGAIDFIPSPSLAKLDIVSRIGFPVVLHLHWEEGFFWKEPKRNYTEVADHTVSKLASLIGNGASLFWTCHNAAPHEIHSNDHFEAFSRIRNFVARNAQMVHVHSEFAGRMIAERYGIPSERIEVISHPSYLEHYDATAPRLSLADRRRFLFFGNMRRYKGIEAVADAFNDIACSDNVDTLRFVGSGDPEYIHPLLAKTRASIDLGRVPDRDVPGIFANTDFALLAFTDALSSGSALLAITFGVPTIVPNLPGIVENLPHELGSLVYDHSSRKDFARAIDYACTMPATEYALISQACVAYAQKIRPSIQSRLLVEALNMRHIVRNSRIH